MMVRVGLKHAVIAPLIKDLSAIESTSGNAEVVYGAVQALPNVQQIDQTATVQSVNVDADDATEEIGQCTGYNGSIARTSFSPEELALILGEKKIDGLNVSTSVDEAPYFALGYKSKMKGSSAGASTYLYMWILKTKFSQSNLTAQSSGSETLTPQPDTINFKSTNRKADDAWRIYTRSDDPNMDKTFFNQETLQKLANAASQTFASPVTKALFVDELPETGAAGNIYIVGSDAYYWDGSKFVTIAKSE